MMASPTRSRLGGSCAGESSDAILHHPARPQTGDAEFDSDPLTRRCAKDNAMQLTGIHHLTAISAKPRENLGFYTGVLGMRLGKKTVNQDNVGPSPCFSTDEKRNPGH